MVIVEVVCEAALPLPQQDQMCRSVAQEGARLLPRLELISTVVVEEVGVDGEDLPLPLPELTWRVP